MTSRFLIRSYAHSIQEIHRAIRADCRSRTHSTGDDYRLFTLNRQVQEIRRFFERIRTVGDDNAIDILAGQQFIAAFSQFEPNIIGHVLAVDAANLLTGYIGIILDFRHSIDEYINTERTSFIASRCRVRCGTSRNCSASCQNLDVWFCLRSKGTLYPNEQHCQGHQNRGYSYLHKNSSFTSSVAIFPRIATINLWTDCISISSEYDKIR